MNVKATRVPFPMDYSQQMTSNNIIIDIAIPMRDLPHAPADLEVTVGTPKWPWLRIIKMTGISCLIALYFASQHCLVYN